MNGESLQSRLQSVRARIEEASRRTGRSPEAVEILAVTKGHPAAVLERVASTGLSMIGENRVGEAEEKRALLGDLGLRWHMVGHLQRNKAARAVELFDAIESVDSLRLARKLDRELGKVDTTLEVLLQVNTSGEEAKYGLEADEALDGAVEDVTRICEHPRLRVRGLMTMAPLTSDETILRRTFRRARRLFERCGEDVPDFEAGVLSMGMSNDFEIAVEEGSTRVRLGTSLLGERP